MFCRVRLLRPQVPAVSRIDSVVDDVEFEFEFAVEFSFQAARQFGLPRMGVTLDLTDELFPGSSFWLRNPAYSLGLNRCNDSIILVVTFLFEKLFMSSYFYDLSRVQYQYFICIFNSIVLNLWAIIKTVFPVYIVFKACMIAFSLTASNELVGSSKKRYGAFLYMSLPMHW